MFESLRSEILDRIFAIGILATDCRGLPAGRGRSAAKGLVFVQTYAAYEFTVITAVRAALYCVNEHRIALNALQTGLQVIAMDAELTSIAAIKKRASWRKRVSLLDKALSTDVAKMAESDFPDDGSHFRTQQLETLWHLFGLPGPVVPESRLIGHIDEMVEHRNAIAHGRETADRIGGRFSDDDISRRIRDTQAICLHIATAFEDHCSCAANLTR